MRKLLATIALAGLLAACGNGSNGVAGDTGGTTPPKDSGIEGTVTLGPTCPVERVDSPCPPMPYQGILRVVAKDGTVVATLHPNDDGTFRVAVDPGTYTVDGGRPHSGGGFPVAHPVEVTVVPGEYAHVDIQFDTGIR